MVGLSGTGEAGLGVFSFEILGGDGIIVLTVTGQTAIEDYQDIAPRFFDAVRSQGVRRLLLDWRSFDGWKSEEEPSITFFSFLEVRSLFDRIAVVSHEGLRNEAYRFEELVRNADKEIRRFRPDRYEAALDWLKSKD